MKPQVGQRQGFQGGDSFLTRTRWYFSSFGVCDRFITLSCLQPILSCPNSQTLLSELITCQSLPVSLSSELDAAEVRAAFSRGQPLLKEETAPEAAESTWNDGTTLLSRQRGRETRGEAEEGRQEEAEVGRMGIKGTHPGEMESPGRNGEAQQEDEHNFNSRESHKDNKALIGIAA